MTAEQVLLTTLARLLATFQTPSSGWHGGGRHVGQDFELCGARPACGVQDARPCSARCQQVAQALEEAAQVLGVTVDDLRGWPKRMKAARPADVGATG